MIPESTIVEWRNRVPWQTNEQVEQDLVICRALTEIFKDEFLSSHLAFRGGTALPYGSSEENTDLIVDLIRYIADFE